MHKDYCNSIVSTLNPQTAITISHNSPIFIITILILIKTSSSVNKTL